MRRRSRWTVRLGVLAASIPSHASPDPRPAPVASFLFRPDHPSYEETVCHPATPHGSTTIPPCVDIKRIETICTPNGTTPLALKAHQACMCTGSFFPSFPFCLACLRLHGLRSQRDLAYSAAVVATASGALCDVPTPTAEFGLLFASALGRVPYPTTGDSALIDAGGGQTAVSLYFTPSGSQGPGRITGDALQATATQLFTAPVGTASSTGLPSSSPSSSSSEEMVSGPSSGMVAGGGVGLSSSTTSGAAVETGIGPGNGTVVSRGERVDAWTKGLVLVVGGAVGAGWLL
ncbi:hypothetical protein MMYC01_208087 [Madurella mycetomatis]|uniref:Uncharacterized protein n=1 Tax=Madurella mycetomatis TaxID=100816 RepID=A0A175VYX7_9PEZI|nr:hypothetical protein MMYC01_208087 [Madurella mycetomatis]